MDRIAEYSGGVAVIPHDRIKDAAAKLAAYEDADMVPGDIVRMNKNYIALQKKYQHLLAMNPKLDGK